MKFADGFWLNKRGYNVAYANEAYQTVVGKNEIKLIATPSHIYNRGQTLGGPNL